MPKKPLTRDDVEKARIVRGLLLLGAMQLDGLNYREFKRWYTNPDAPDVDLAVMIFGRVGQDATYYTDDATDKLSTFGIKL